MADPPTSEEIPNSGPRDFDVYCLECGYNLRGLSGDPVRCPECGYDNPMGDLEIPAAIIREQLDKMETPPAMCVLMVLVMLIGVLWHVLILLSEPRALVDSSGPWICAVVLLLIPAFAWPVLVTRFRASCLDAPGWRPALVRYHRAALGLTLQMIGAVVMVALPSFIEHVMDQRLSGTRALAVNIGALVLAGILLVGVLFRAARVHQRLKDIMHPLQREVAVTIARQELRKRLRHGHGRQIFKA